MRLMSLELLKERASNRKVKSSLASKRLEHRLLQELTEKLSDLLKENDRVMLEVNPSVVTEFINILSEKVLSMYEYEQVDKNKFIFYSKDILL